ncbi:MAG: fimbrillin family protein [Rikenellaceae bacterium]
MRYIIIAITTLIVLGSCAKESDTAIDPSEDGAVKFANAQIASRTEGSSWVDGDEVGIYMSDADNALDDNRTNVRYTTDAAGNFSVYSGVTPIYYPQSTTDEVTFNAYYPYSDDLSNDRVTIDVSKQNGGGQGAVDFMVAEINNSVKQVGIERFEFYHSLSMLVLNLTHNSEITTFDGMVTKVEDINTVASFDVLTGDIYGDSSSPGEVIFGIDSVADDGSEMSISAILLPEDLSAGTVIKFIQGADLYTLTLSDDLVLAKGTRYTYGVVVGRDTVLVTGDSEIEDWNEEMTDNLYAKE